MTMIENTCLIIPKYCVDNGQQSGNYMYNMLVNDGKIIKIE